MTDARAHAEAICEQQGKSTALTSASPHCVGAPGTGGDSVVAQGLLRPGRFHWFG